MASTVPFKYWHVLSLDFKDPLIITCPRILHFDNFKIEGITVRHFYKYKKKKKENFQMGHTKEYLEIKLHNFNVHDSSKEANLSSKAAGSYPITGSTFFA